jgi:hypothetical protein
MIFVTPKWLIVFCLVFLLPCMPLSQETIPVEQIKPGMTGYGLSVFRNNRIERFQIQVIEVLNGILPGEDIILVRCEPVYGGFDINRSGVIAGMSGSPIYIEGKLAGALSLGWSFSKEPIAGVTPIKSMLDITRRPMEKKMAMDTSLHALPQSLGGLVRLQTPLLVSGVTQEAMNKLQKEILGDPWLLVQSGGNHGGAEVGEKLSPGAAIGCQLMSGDIDITAIGTVTWVSDNEVLAFGHSLFNAGELFLPITAARIVTVMENQMLSFKLGFPLQQVGSLWQDRTAGIYGRLGNVCETLPMTVVVKNKIHGQQQTFHVNMLRHPILTLRLAMLAVFNFLSMQEPNLGGCTTYIRTRIECKNDKKPLLWEDVYSGDKVTPLNLVTPLRYVADNPFQPADVANIVIQIEVMAQLRQTQIAYLRAYPAEVQAGDSVQLAVTLLSHQEQEKTLTLRLTVPATLPAGDYALVACSGSDFAPAIPVPENSPQYVEALQRMGQYRNSHLVAFIQLPKFRVFCHNKEMADLPESIVGNLLPVNSTRDLQILPETYSVFTNTDYMISGTATINIKVKTN